MMQSPLVAMVWEGNKAGAVIKKLVGSTEPSTSDVGTIRGDYTVDSYSHAAYEDRAVRNLIHCTDPEDGAEEAEREIGLWFSEAEIMSYTTAQEAIMYDVNLDGTPD
jgi:nucleoside-diphosphate kinase